MTGSDEDDAPARLTAAAAYLLEGQYKCDTCSRPTKVLTVMAVGPFQPQGDVWVGEDDFSCILKRLDQLPEPIAHAAAAASGGRFKPDYSRTACESYLMNHCEYCGGKVGDWFIHNPGAVFFPTMDGDLDLIAGQRFEGPFVFDEPTVSSSSWTGDWLEAHGVSVPRPPERPPKKPRAKRTPK